MEAASVPVRQYLDADENHHLEREFERFCSNVTHVTDDDFLTGEMEADFTFTKTSPVFSATQTRFSMENELKAPIYGGAKLQKYEEISNSEDSALRNHVRGKKYGISTSIESSDLVDREVFGTDVNSANAMEHDDISARLSTGIRQVDDNQRRVSDDATQGVSVQNSRIPNDNSNKKLSSSFNRSNSQGASSLALEMLIKEHNALLRGESILRDRLNKYKSVNHFLRQRVSGLLEENGKLSDRLTSLNKNINNSNMTYEDDSSSIQCRIEEESQIDKQILSRNENEQNAFSCQCFNSEGGCQFCSAVLTVCDILNSSTEDKSNVGNVPVRELKLKNLLNSHPTVVHDPRVNQAMIHSMYSQAAISLSSPIDSLDLPFIQSFFSEGINWLSEIKQSHCRFLNSVANNIEPPNFKTRPEHNQQQCERRNHPQQRQLSPEKNSFITKTSTDFLKDYFMSKQSPPSGSPVQVETSAQTSGKYRKRWSATKDSTTKTNFKNNKENTKICNPNLIGLCLLKMNLSNLRFLSYLAFSWALPPWISLLQQCVFLKFLDNKDIGMESSTESTSITQSSLADEPKTVLSILGSAEKTYRSLRNEMAFTVLERAYKSTRTLYELLLDVDKFWDLLFPSEFEGRPILSNISCYSLKNAKRNLWHYAFISGNSKLVSILTEQTSFPEGLDQTDEEGRTPLDYLAELSDSTEKETMLQSLVMVFALKASEFYKVKNYLKAKEFYTEAIRYHEKDSTSPTVRYNLCKLNFNKARCLFHLDAWTECIAYCTECIELEPTYCNALETRAHAYEILLKWDAAYEDYKRLSAIQSSSSSSSAKKHFASFSGIQPSTGIGSSQQAMGDTQKFRDAKKRMAQVKVQVEATPYDILEIPEKASDSEIKKAYRRLARVWHPDKIGVSAHDDLKERAAVHFQRVHDAFTQLSNSSTRQKVDFELFLNKGFKKSSGSSVGMGAGTDSGLGSEWAAHSASEFQQFIGQSSQRSYAYPPPRYVPPVVISDLNEAEKRETASRETVFEEKDVTAESRGRTNKTTDLTFDKPMFIPQNNVTKNLQNEQVQVKMPGQTNQNPEEKTLKTELKSEIGAQNHNISHSNAGKYIRTDISNVFENGLNSAAPIDPETEAENDPDSETTSCDEQATSSRCTTHNSAK